MNLFSEPVTALMLRLVVATLIGVTLGLCSLEQATHSAKKAGEVSARQHTCGGQRSGGIVFCLPSSFPHVIAPDCRRRRWAGPGAGRPRCRSDAAPSTSTATCPQ